MSLTGYLSLYTTLIGWQQYQSLWHVMVSTGLVFIPFIGIVLNAFLEPFESQEPKSASVISIRRLGIHIVGALLVIEFCCVPIVPLNPQVLHYQPSCVPDAQVATPGHTGTTYDNQFKAIDGVKVPVLWYLVMAVSNGFTHAATSGLLCSAVNYRQLQTQLDVSRISDPNVKQETIQFFNDCYVPAYAKYMSGDLTAQQNTFIQQDLSTYGQDDLGWIGSRVFQDTRLPFYSQLSATQPVSGFLFDPERDQVEGQVSDHSPWGMPVCNDWWQNSNAQAGLRLKLQQALPATFLQRIAHLDPDKNEVIDAGIRHLIKHSFDPNFSLGEISRGYESLDDEVSGHYLSRYLGSEVGVSMAGLSYYPKLALLINALPVIQALLLMAIYMLLAIIIPFASYRLHFIITGSSVIFAITFWSFLWHMVLYVDNHLIQSLYFPQTGPFSVKAFLVGGGSNERFVDMIVGTLYVALPLLFLILMSWAGYKVGQAVMGAVSSMINPASEGGSAAGRLGSAVLRSGINVIKK